jgi:tetratricopeptide (TPR) repeat protein
MTTASPGALIHKGYSARREDRLEDARGLFTRAVELSRNANDSGSLAQALAGLGQIERDLHHDLDARRHYEEAVAACRTLQEPLRLAHTVRHLADILRGQGETSLAESSYLEALQIYRSTPEHRPLDLANTIRGFALLKSDGGDAQEARSLWQQAKDLYAAVDVEAGVKESERQLSLLNAT